MPQSDRMRGYVGNLGVKTPVDVATTANITLSAEQTIDGVTTSESRVLVKNQSTASENGVYISSTGTWTRAADVDGDYDIEAGTFVAVGQGTVNAGQIFVQTTVNPTIGTSNLVFESLASYLLNATNVLGIGTTGNTNAPLWEAADANWTGITMGATSILDNGGTYFEIYHNIDRNFNLIAADGGTYVYVNGEDFNIYSYPAAAAGAPATGGTKFRLYPQAMVVGAGTLRLPPANEYQIALFGNAWIHGATSETASQVLTISQNSYKNAAGNFIHAFTDEVSQVVLRDGTVVLKCAAAGAGGATVSFTDALVAAPTGVTVSNLTVTGTATFGTLNSSEIDFLQAGTGAVATNVQSKLRETFSVVDFGADKTGVADSSAAIRLAIIAAAAARVSGAIRTGVEFPVGKYKISQPLPVIANVELFCNVKYGAMIDFTGSAANAVFSATLSGSTFTTTVGLGFGTQVSGCAMRNLFISALSATSTVTSRVMEITNAADGHFEDVYVYTNITDIGGMYFDHCVSARIVRPRTDKATTSGGTGIYLSGQTNATTIEQPQVEGSWATGAIIGGVGNKIIGGVIESSPIVGLRVLGEKISIDGTWFEGCTGQDIILGDTGSTAYATDIRNTLHGGGATNLFKVVEGTFFHFDKSCRQQTGTAAYTNKFDAPVSAALCNGTIQVYADPSTFTVSSINLAGKGAINIEVYGSNDAADKTRYGLYSSASSNAVSLPGSDVVSFTPAVTFGGGSTGITYAANGQVGSYWKDGRVVHFTLRLAMSSKGSSTGVAAISGLPFASLNVVNLRHTFSIETTEVNLDAAGFFYGVSTSLPENSTVISLREQGDNTAATPLTDVDFTNTSVVNITGSYLTN